MEDLKTKKIIKQNPSGWVAMPPEHWDALKKLMKSKGIEFDE